MQQLSIYPRNVTERIDADPRDHVITQRQMYPQAFNQPAMFGEDKRVDPRPLYSPHTVLGAGTNPQLSSSKIVHPGVTQYPSGIPQQQIMGMSSNYSPYMVPGTGTNPQLSNSLGNYLGMMQNPSGMPQQQIMGMSSNYSPYMVPGTGTNPQLSNSLGNYLGMMQNPSGMPQQQIMGMSSNYSPYMVPGTGTNPQLSNSLGNYLGMMQNPSGMPQQQIMGMSSNTSRGRMVPTNRGAPYIGATDNTNSRSVSFQSSSISNPNNVNLYSHSTNPAAVPVCESSQPIHKFLPRPRPRRPPPVIINPVSILMLTVL